MKRTRFLTSLAALALATFAAQAVAADKASDQASSSDAPIRALLVTGGCCHDYEHQKTILSEGISKKANVQWDIAMDQEKEAGDTGTKHKMSVYKKPEWWKGYDVVVHDECWADTHDEEFINGILAAHRAGVPAVNLHCAMHCYRPKGFTGWFEMLGLQSASHGAQKPIEVSYVAKEHPITKGFKDWTTINEELYNNIKVFDTATPLARGKQDNQDMVIAWTNDYKGTRVFCTTLGHNNQTVGDDRYLELVTRGLLWSVNKLDDAHLKPAKQTLLHPETAQPTGNPTPAKSEKPAGK